MKLDKHIKETIRNAILINDRVDTIIKIGLLTVDRLEEIIFEIWDQSVYNNEGVYHLRDDIYYINKKGDFIINKGKGIHVKNGCVYPITYNIITYLLRFEGIQRDIFEEVHYLLMESKFNIECLEEEKEELKRGE